MLCSSLSATAVGLWRKYADVSPLRLQGLLAEAYSVVSDACDAVFSYPNLRNCPEKMMSSRGCYGRGKLKSVIREILLR